MALVVIQMCLFVLLVGFVSVAVDFGHVQVVKAELQLAADAAARAAVVSLPSGPAAARTSAATIAGLNTADGQSVTLTPATDVVFGVWNPNTRTFQQVTGAAEANANAVQVSASRTSAAGNGVSLTWARTLGQSTCNVRTRATVCSTGASGAYSLIGINGITVSGNGYTDSYNSARGAYSAASAHHLGSVASNGYITLSNFARIDGDCRCGIGMSTSVLNSATVTGLNAPMASTLSYPSVTLPGSYTDLGDVYMTNGTLSLPGGTYLLHSLTMSGSAHFTWTGPVVLYIRDSYTISGNAAIDTYQNRPANRILNFLPTCTTATWTGTNDCVGELYAPDTDFTISGTVDLYGRVTARTINLSSGGGMHYDEALAPPGGTATREGVTTVK